MAYLTGSYEHQIDAKNRIRIPNKLKLETEGLYLSKGTDGCLFVFSSEEMNEILAKFSAIKITDKAKRQGQRAFLDSIVQVEFDGQGRMTIPKPYKEFAKIDKDIVICGNFTHVEVWAKEIHTRYHNGEDTTTEFDTVFNSLEI